MNRQIANETLAPLFSYGLIKERMAALVTDAMRAEYLKREGYDTQILEFIDMEHTPKNILIRAIYTGNKGKIQRQSAHVKKCFTSIQCWGDYWISRMKREKKEYKFSKLR